jgi:SNF2 family DNA or RNA helicase
MIYTPPYKPYDHQQSALDKMLHKRGFALFMAMRTGKTKILLDDFGRLELEGRVKDLLIIAPGGVYRTWLGQLDDHLSTDLKRRIKTHLWVSGNAVTHRRALEAFLSPTEAPRAFLINVEALSSVQAARMAALAFLDQRPSMIAVDESTIIKTPSSKRTQFIIEKLAPKSAYRRILSGLPSPKSPLDLYSQMEFLDWRILNFRSYYAFRARYAIMYDATFGGRTVKVVSGFKQLDDLQRRIEPDSYRVLLKDCYDLPDKIYMKWEVNLTPEQHKAYNEMLRYATTQLSQQSFVSATVVIAQIIRLHQILMGHTIDENGNEVTIPQYRTEALIDVIEDIGEDEKIIIWCSYDFDVRLVRDILLETYGEGSTAAFWGGNRKDREEEEARFKTDPNCRFMVATAAAGGRGREWSAATTVIYYSNSTNLEHRDQSEERAQAIGKKESVLYIDLVVPNSVDEKMIETLKKKIDLSSAVMGDGYRAWLI